MGCAASPARIARPPRVSHFSGIQYAILLTESTVPSGIQRWALLRLPKRLRTFPVLLEAADIFVCKIGLRAFLPRALQLVHPRFWLIFVGHILDGGEQPVALGVDGVVHDWMPHANMLGLFDIVVANVQVDGVVRHQQRVRLLVVVEDDVASHRVRPVRSNN